MTIHSLVQPVTTEVAVSSELDPRAAATDLLERLGTDAPLYMLFVTAGYPRDELAAALRSAWGDRLIGCTSAGNIAPCGFESGPVVAIAFRGGDLVARTVLIEPVSDLAAAMDKARPEIELLLRGSRPNQESFALLLVDGLSMVEEHLAALLKNLLGEIPLVGGSAGDDLSFTETAVLAEGSFGSDRATVTIISTTTPFRVFRLQHYEPGEKVLVITAASPERRLIHEINGIPAATAFAEMIGVAPEDLGPEEFSAHPVLFRASNQNWVRSISQALPDGSLHMHSAIDIGAVLRLGRSSDAVGMLRDRLASIRDELGGEITGLLVCDCVLRRIELTRAGLDGEIGSILAGYQAAGFSTYGEQFDDFHMNATMVGVAFGPSTALSD